MWVWCVVVGAVDWVVVVGEVVWMAGNEWW